jgi:hypothetical protein
MLVLARFGVSVVPIVLGQLRDTLNNPDQLFFISTLGLGLQQFLLEWNVGPRERGRTS